MQPSHPTHPDQQYTHPPARPVPQLPTPVVKVLSPFGIEYLFMTLMLFASAGSLVGVLFFMIDGVFDFGALAFPAAVCAITLPVFGVLFMRLRRIEARHPELSIDASKRRSAQFTQTVAFLACIAALIAFIYTVFTWAAGENALPVWKAGLNALVVLAVAGGVLWYYFREEHRHMGRR